MQETTRPMRQLMIAQVATKKMAGRACITLPNGQVVWRKLSSDKGLKTRVDRLISPTFSLPNEGEKRRKKKWESIRQ